ncbi:MAG TPA: leishmanolysin-related zinc metalloendopeptidase [Gemmatimonadaceae bacterium]|nr:leishmanolysin-related zinc metalloendopeptidase [Gemmatimonadaceae bacterium]
MGVRVVSGDGQAAPAGTTLGAAPQFVVYDASGSAIADVKFSVSVSSGGGKISGTPGRTSSSNTSIGTWTLGPRAGANTITVSVTGVAPLIITATGVAGPAAHIAPITPIALSGRAGEPAAAISARVTDAFENPVGGAAVELSATAGNAPPSATADAGGVVNVTGWILGTVVGQDGLTLRSGPATVTFIANVLPADPVALTRVDSAPPAALAGALLAPVRLRLTDRFGNAVGDQQLTLTVTGGGGSLGANTISSDAGGIVMLAGWTLGRTTLPQIVHASTATLSADVTAVVQSAFHIDVRFFGPDMTDAQKALFTNAAARISAVIVGSIPDQTLSGLSVSAACGVPGLPTLDETIHGIVVFASVASIDGPGGILAGSGPCLLRNAPAFFPSVGAMLFDADDLAGLASEGILQDVITHEMLHTVGFGTIWDTKGLLLAGGTVTSAFAGPRARQGCVDDGGSAVCANSVPLENDMIPGTADAHWRESIFGPELMTGFVNHGAMPLSAITVGSLADLGYTVNPLAADPFVVPTSATHTVVPSKTTPWEIRIQPQVLPP